MTSLDTYNAKIIAEFRAEQGGVGGEWEGAPLLLLHHVGARSGKERITPLLFRRLVDRYPLLSEFERKTFRVMPVIVLSPRAEDHPDAHGAPS